MIRIATATLEDLAHVASWICPMDRREMAETRDPDDYVALAHDAYQCLIHKVALDDAGRPIFAFGATPLGPEVAHVWGYKTSNGSTAIRAVTKYLLQEMIPGLRGLGVWQAVCLVHQDNTASRKWLAYLGFQPRATIGETGTLLMYQRDYAPDEHLPVQ
jgi:hypothetical protein